MARLGYIEMNTDLREKSRNDFEKDSFKLMNNAAFGKTKENVRKYRDIKLVRNYLVWEPNYHTTKLFADCLLATEMKQPQILMKKPVYLGLSILELSKILMYELWYGYVKLKWNCMFLSCHVRLSEWIHTL